MIGRGRIIKFSDVTTTDGATEVSTQPLPAPERRGVQIVRRSVVEAELKAEALRAEAAAEIAQMRVQAEREFTGLRLAAVEQGRAEGYAELTAQLLKLKATEATLEDAVQDRVLGIARLLAERLINKSLELNPSLMADLVSTVLSEVRGACKIQLSVCPADQPYLMPELLRLSLPAASISVVADPELAPGQLRVLTELGVFDANLGKRLDTLCRVLASGGRP